MSCNLLWRLSGNSSRAAMLSLAACLILGASLRFYRLGAKTFWFDETWTAAHVTGHRLADAERDLPAGQSVRAEQLRRYVQFDQSSSLGRTLRLIAQTDANHPPLFYVMEYGWGRIFGDSPAALRGLSAVIGVVDIAAFAWLCWIMLQPWPLPTQTHGLLVIGTALFAISPFHLVYAQEAREYSLWTLMILVSTAALIHAMRRDSAAPWALYALSAIAGMYTHLLFATVIAAHLLYVLIATLAGPRRDWPDVRRPLLPAVIAMLATALAFAPWVVVMYQSRRRLEAIMDWQAQRMPPLMLLQRWAGALGNTFVDLWYQDAARSTPSMWYASRGAAALAAIVALYAVWFVARQAPRTISMLIVALAVVPFAMIAAPDLLMGGQRSALSRYLTPSLIAAQLAVTLLLSAMISSRGRTRVAGMLLVGLLLCGGAVSDLIISQATTWRNKGSQQFIEMARMINATPDVPVLADTSLARGHVIALSRYLHPQVRIEFVSGEDGPDGSTTAASDASPPLWLLGFESPQQRRRFESTGASARLVCDMFPPLWKLGPSS